MDELLSEFLTETNESIGTLDSEVVELEQNPNNPELLANIFRLVHTIKGTCGFLGLPRLERVAHASENVLGKFRDGEIEVTPASVTLILESLDRIKELLAILEETEAEPDGDDTELVDKLNAKAEGRSEAAPAAPEPAPEPEPVLPDPEERETFHGEATEAELEAAFAAASGPDDMPAPAAVDVAPAPAADPEPEPEPEPAPRPAPTAEAAPPAKKADKAESTVAGSSIRVSVDMLENLMNMVSELVLTRNQLLQMVRGRSDSEFTVPLQRLSHVTTDLQEGVMKTRMQPIGNAWAKLPRIVRDLSLDLGKKIELVMNGADTELDRQVLELIKDPLTHMVRNSGDHGIEVPAIRAAAGKPETGHITLNAYHEGGHIIIQISDDGGGLPVDKLGAKAVANGLTTEAQLESMSDQQILQFIFKPGFSTAEKVTSVSGRGVGMDVVRTNIDKIGGTIDVKSVSGKGTSFTVKIPLTLAIVSALIVACGGERFAIPQLSVVELVGVSGDTDHKIEKINETPVLRLRNRLLPLVNLRDVLGLTAENGNGEDEGESGQGALLVEEIEQSTSFIVVSQVGNYTFGIVVDKVFDTEEIVVKPVAPILRDIAVFSGNTILGDGSVIMILDPNGIADTTGEIAMPDADKADEGASSEAWDEEQVALLVFRAGGEEPKAVPLALIARLEEIDVDTIETSDNELVVQYRGKLMPLVKLDGGYEAKTAGRQPVLVFADHNRSMGLIVDEIIDIVEQRLNIELASNRDGLIGTAVVANKATEVVDAAHYLRKAFGNWFEEEHAAAFGEDARQHRVLLVDDSSFFLNLLTPVLATAGYEVTTADNSEAALELREAGRAFDIIVSDIEMPGMNGFAFAEEVRKDARWSQTPMVALSSHTAPADLERGRSVGFTDYVAKLDRETLLQTMSHMLSQGGSA